ncbi:multicopper oxidase domain-containing protein [Nodularia spumigena CS-584]|jgi:spore coat protein A, manganese oxidase|uniref:Spore coat protein A n=2 Tax=Nodularia spumigena TaxID=70799 RepID=A0A2S0Q503_NODSP|nr:multicopper oxidase domain-containing protein [Nodularia spumigena]AVZ29795.1 spore coat protein A [Nodularia spumigena UHCC 0039]AHJ28255.1 Multicopper oxidase [Nodularia spumigena CCY9414]MDB9383982.1 multicopper oxidase domain-containing protein [Nodularia spumigena CS-584]MEA5524068.1 multicopper oxidase domain-containing protein [Nodularia spumigena UHCC 0143]MEA5614759.1 multicopper oxidase domain-containing protein [Nodularia spumigena UHCC 0040]
MNHSPYTFINMKNKVLFLGLFLFILVLSLNSVKAQSTNSYSLLNPNSQPQFINSLPSPQKIDATKGGNFTLEMKESEQWLGLYANPGEDGEYGTSDDERLNTTIWGYGLAGQNVTYPGPTFIAQESVPIRVEWENKLPREHLFPIDIEKLHSQPLREAFEQKLTPAVVHLHGGHTESASDGLPDEWYTQDYEITGPDWVQKIDLYDNNQEAATLWYHDHTNMVTRLNSYAGLAGYYLLRDDNENSLINNDVLPSGDYERELLIQDRKFTTDGQLFYPEQTNANPPGVPSRTGAYGDLILVNGMVWPKLEVEPRKYRLRLLNGSDSRFYKLEFYDSNKKMYLIGTEQGFVENPVALDHLVLSPSERADVIVDFTNDAGKEFILRNYGPGADPNTTGQIIKFTVNQPLSNIPIATVDTDESDGLTTQLRQENITPLTATVPPKQLALFQLREAGNNDLFLLGTLEDGSFKYSDPVTEKTLLDQTEVWELYNTTQYTHTIHIHLIAFQVLNRQNFRGNVVSEIDPKKGETKQYLRNVYFQSDPKDPEIYEQGRKDSIIVYPNEVVRVIAKYDRAGKYVWHCHVLIHEDHDMMRPMEIVTELE